MAPATEPRKPGPVSLPDGSLLCERVKLTPVNIEFKGDLRGFDWMSFIPAWDDVDVLIKSHGLVFLHKDGSTRKIFGFGPVESLDRKGIAFDGKHLWVSGGYASGVYVLNKQGKTVAHAKKSDGMPPFYVNGILHATEPGRVFASGEINQGDRSWIAELTLKKNKVTIDVFHKARKAWKGDAAATDPFVRFEPTGMVSMMDQNSKKWLFIFRDYHWEPLLVDCQTKAVSIYPTGIGLKTCVYDRIAYYPNDAFARHADLNADGGRRYTFDSTKPLLARTEGARRMLSSDTQEASMIEYQGWLYCLGHYKWLRCNVKTNKVEILVENRRNSPGQGGPWAMAVSRQFGLVTWDWNKQTLYQLSVITEKAGNNRE